MNASAPVVYNDLSSLSRLKLQSKEDPSAALNEVAKQFESVFVTMMMKAMRDTLPKDGMLASNEMENYQEMFDQQLSLDLSRKGGLGLADLISRQMAMGLGFESGAAPVNTEQLDPVLSDAGALP
ncbi:MAG: rod-binding protein [Pseudomonadota bacterium]